jgi:hypothetical protein
MLHEQEPDIFVKDNIWDNIGIVWDIVTNSCTSVEMT